MQSRMTSGLRKYRNAGQSWVIPHWHELRLNDRERFVMKIKLIRILRKRTGIQAIIVIASVSALSLPQAQGAESRGRKAARDAGVQSEKAAKALSPEAQFVQNAAKANMFEVAMGKAAQDQASSTAVKELGSTLVRDHAEAIEQLKQVAGKKKLDVPATLSPSDQEKLRRFSTLTGKNFDEVFLKEMTEQHEKDQVLLEHAVASLKDAELNELAKGALPKVKDHLRMLRALQAGETKGPLPVKLEKK